MPRNTNKCRVPKCKESHESHYCRLCEEDDTDHFSNQCPYGVVLYHGTRLKSIKGIAEHELNPGDDDNRLGAGVYFATTFDVAKSIAQGTMDPSATGAAVFECNVYLGQTIDFGHDIGKLWHSNYDSATAIHPPWTREGAASHYFPEYCVKHAHKCSCIFTPARRAKENTKHTLLFTINIV